MELVLREKHSRNLSLTRNLLSYIFYTKKKHSFSNLETMKFAILKNSAQIFVPLFYTELKYDRYTRL